MLDGACAVRFRWVGIATAVTWRVQSGANSAAGGRHRPSRASEPHTSY